MNYYIIYRENYCILIQYKYCINYTPRNLCVPSHIIIIYLLIKQLFLFFYYQ